MLVLHVGFAKAATTFLQKRVFPNIDDINYLGRCYGDNLPDSKRADWVYDFVFNDRISLKSFADQILDGMRDNDAVNMISHEVLLRPFKTYRSIQRMSNLKKYFSEVKLIVSVRRQTDIILSRSVHDRGVINYNSISDALDFKGITQCKWPKCERSNRRYVSTRNKECECRLAGIKYINVPFYNYLNVFRVLQSLFGRSHVHFIVSEALQENCAPEIDRLTRFLGVRSVDEQILENIAGKRDNKRRATPYYERCYKEFVESGARNRVFEYFKEANASLSEILHVDLKKYGYY